MQDRFAGDVEGKTKLDGQDPFLSAKLKGLLETELRINVSSRTVIDRLLQKGLHMRGPD